jgi:hypothetical protein
MTIKIPLSRSLVAFFLLNAGFVFAGGFKINIITTSQLTITVPEDRFLKITNFTQQGGTDRGVVSVTLSGDAGGTANVLAATRIDLSTGINSQNFPEIGNAVFIAGPAEVTVPSVAGATLLITYKKGPNEGGGETTPIVSPTPSATPTITPTVTPTPTSSPTPTAFPTITPRPTLGPLK